MERTETITRFSDWVRQRRMVLGLTQAELAARAGCALVTIKKFEQETRRPSRQLAELLAIHLAIPIEQRTAFLRLARGEYVEAVVATAHLTPPPPFLQTTGSVAGPTPCVARERELAQLETHLHATLRGSGRIVFVTGEAGSGKTTLMAEFARRAEEHTSDLVVAHGNCDAYAGTGDPYLPFRDILALLSADVDARWRAGALSQEQARRLWALLPQTVQALVDYGPDLLDVLVSLADLRQRAKAVAPQRTANWLDVLSRLEQRQARPAVPQQRQLFEQYSRVLELLAAHHPLLLVLDDLQWTDTASAGLLFHLGRRLSGSRVLIVGAYRPSEVPLALSQEDGLEERHPLAPIVHEFKRRYGDIEIDLSNSAPETGRTFVGALLDQEPNRLNQSFREALFQRTQGHPLFTVELLREMAARRDLVRDESGRWSEGAAADWEALPSRVEAVIDRRIGRLPLHVQEALRIASVEGETFTAEVVARVQKVDEQQLVRQLGSVVDRQHRLVRSLGSERLGQQLLSHYRFGHILFQNYLYQSLDATERVYLHAAVGRALEEIYAEQAEQVAIQLAHHFQMTGLTAKAIAYLYQAATRAARLSAHKEAIVHLSKGLSLLESIPASAERARQELRLQIALGVALAAVKGWPAPEVGQTFERARLLAQEVGDASQLSSILTGLQAFYAVRGQLRLASTYGQQCLRMAQAQNDPALLVVGHFRVGANSFHRGELALARTHLEQALAAYAPVTHRQHIPAHGLDYGIYAMAYRAHVLWYLGYPAQALQQSQAALEVAQELDHPYSLVVTQSYAAMLHQYRGEWRATQSLAEAILALCAEYDFVYYAAWATIMRGWALAEQGESEAGIVQMQKGLAALQAMGTGIREAYYLGLLAEAQGRAGRIEDGLRLLDEALMVIHERDERSLEAECYRLRGELLWRQDGDEQEVERSFRQAIAVAQQQQAKSLEVRAVTSLVRLWQQQGKAAAARPQIDPTFSARSALWQTVPRGAEKVGKLAALYQWFTEGFDTPDLQAAKTLLDELALEP